MSHIILKLNKITKKITISKSQSAEDLGRLISYSFGTKEKIIGAQDSCGKFYDLQYISKNIKSLRTQTFSLVTTKDINEDNNMSFASSHVQAYEPQKIHLDFVPNETDDTELPEKITQGYIGTIGDIQLFQELFLSEAVTIVISYQGDEPKAKLPYPYYLFKTTKDSIIVYSKNTKVCELYVKNWEESINRLKGVINNINGKSQNRSKQKQSVSESQKQQDEQVEESEDKAMKKIIENLKNLLAQQAISELDFYKLKTRLIQNPRQFISKYQGVKRLEKLDSLDYEKLRFQILKSKEQKYRFQSLINGFKATSRQNGASRGVRNQIPIIVRKYNNQIQKISTSYPLTMQQQQAVNIISELELKGLISQKDSGYFKSYVIQEQPEILQLFLGYFRNSYDQIELSKKLKALRQRGFYQGQSSQQLMRLLIKHARRNSFQLLRKLAIQNNSHLMNCYEKYRNTSDCESFSQGIERIANYYRSKDQIEQFAEPKIKRYN